MEDVHLLYCAHLINIFLFLRGVELRHFCPSEMPRGCLVSVICNSLYMSIYNQYFGDAGPEQSLVLLITLSSDLRGIV